MVGMGKAFSNCRTSGRYWWWKRGASAAAWMSRPLSTMLMRSLATVVMMVEPPGEPRTRRSLPGVVAPCLPTMGGSLTMVGVMQESGRLPGAMALAGP